MKRIYNCFGDDISGTKPRLQKESFGKYDEENNPIPYWPEENDKVDDYGFDKRYENENGEYLQTVILPKNTML